jgi:hypothetical protein
MMEKLPIHEVALRLRVSQDVVRRRIRSGELKAYRQSGPQGNLWMVELPEGYGAEGEDAYLREQGERVTPWWWSHPAKTGKVHYVELLGVEEMQPTFLCGLVSDNIWNALGHSEEERCPECLAEAKAQDLPF